MKILKRRVVSSFPLAPEVKAEYRKPVMDIPGRLKVETKFAVISNVLEGLVKESDDDIDEEWLYSKIQDPRYHWCHLHMDDKEWRDYKLRKTLNGSSELVSGTFITYGRWKEWTIGPWHEGMHCGVRFFKALWGLVHYHFYGLKEIPKKGENPKRYVRTPDPEIGWAKLPWEKLPDLETPLDGLFRKLRELQEKLRRRQRFQPLVERKAEILKMIMSALGHPIRLTSTFRSSEEQDKLYAQGRTTPGSIVTNAKGGESAHNFGVAFDVVFVNEGYDGPWDLVGKFGKLLGFTWGGDWKKFVDRPHFEFLLDYTLGDFKKGNVDFSRYD